MFMDNLQFYTIYVHMLVYVNDYNHNAWNELCSIYFHGVWFMFWKFSAIHHINVYTMKWKKDGIQGILKF